MTIKQAADAIKSSGSVALIAHMMPDGDTLGSSLAMYHALNCLGKKTGLFCQDPPPDTYLFLKGIDRFKCAPDTTGSYELCIAIDCSDLDRLGSLIPVFKSSGRTLNIDHHKSNTCYADLNLVDENAAATGELIYNVIESIGACISPEIAIALYTAISTDTGNFSYSNTTPASMRIAAGLIEAGVNVDEVTTRLYRTHSLHRIKLLSKVLASLELYENNRIAFLTITRKDLEDTGAQASDLENMVNYAKEISGVELAVLFKETSDGG
ncbi:MAG TPA: bifunctional oligoribonuclease/PAP phosphatase NrnA, partial [Candidatus Atribacteria bacterium]|nr:bifunctional oligoribonuclease/PAP phosphatase NrnA [Candidatus Atribacteria bacterium]